MTPCNRFRVIIAVCVALMIGAHGQISAQTCEAPSNNSIFNITLCVDGAIQTAGSDSITDIIDIVDNESLDARFPSYVEDVSSGTFQVDLRGLPVRLSYDQNSTQLLFEVPSLNIYETFDGGTRDASNDEFVDYIQNNGEAILQELLRVSAVDPLAGNPASVQSEMAVGQFDIGVDPAYDNLQPGSSFGLGARFGSYSTGPFTQNIFTLPITYAYTFANHDKLIVSAPLTYVQAEGSSAYRANLSLGYRKNIFPIWSLTPSIGYGIAGSQDLGSLGHIVSGALTSDLMLYDGGKYRISMGNMAGYYLTLPVRIGDYSVDYDLRNTIVRNGLLFSMPMQRKFWGRSFSLDVYVTDTRYFGDALYSDNNQEIGLSFGPQRAANKLAPNYSSHPIGIGVKYLTGDGDVDGFELNFGYRF